MSNALRSTIAIGVLWLVLFMVGGWYTYYKQAGELKTLQKEEKEAHKACDEAQAKVEMLPGARTTLASLRAQWAKRDKIVPTDENSRLSYSYFNFLARKGGLGLMFDFTVLAEDPDAEVPQRTYQLKGEDSFENLFSFIYYLENYPLLYKIESLSIDSAPIAENEEGDILGVKFEMTIKVYFGTSSSIDQAFTPRFVSNPPRLIDPFYPLILADVPKNSRDLPEVEKAQLQALTQDTAFIIDQHKNLVAMQVGDEVYLGYLTAIDVAKNECVFTLNKGGIVEKYVLRLNFEERKGEKR